MKPFFCDNENVPHHVSWVYGCCCSTQQDAGSYTQIYAPYIHLECLLTVLKLSGAAEGTPEVNPPELIHSGRSWRRRWSSRSSAFSEQSCWKLLHQQEWWKLTGETGEDCELISMNERWMVATIPGSVIISSICKSISLSIYPLSLCEISREHKAHGLIYRDQTQVTSTIFSLLNKSTNQRHPVGALLWPAYQKHNNHVRRRTEVYSTSKGLQLFPCHRPV